MPAERRFDTGYWNDPDIMKYPMKAKMLYLYLWTNRHCNQAGLYEIALETIQWETGLDLEEIPNLMQILAKKVAWYPDRNLVWVKNFLHRQSQSPKFLAAAAKCIKPIPDNGLVSEFIKYNEQYGLVIPYQYPIDRVSIPPYSHALSNADEEKGVVKGEEKTKKTRESEVNEIFAEMRAYLGYPDKIDKDPIPSYGKEGQAIKRMLTRGFTRVAIMDCWRHKVSQRGGEFVSMTWVNEDIGKPSKKKPGSREPSSEEEIAASIQEAGK